MTERSRPTLNLDLIALDCATRIDDLYAQGHNSTVQRKAKVQLEVIRALKIAANEVCTSINHCID